MNIVRENLISIGLFSSIILFLYILIPLIYKFAVSDAGPASEEQKELERNFKKARLIILILSIFYLVVSTSTRIAINQTPSSTVDRSVLKDRAESVKN